VEAVREGSLFLFLDKNNGENLGFAIILFSNFLSDKHDYPS
jgi:hypothetical protein